MSDIKTALDNALKANASYADLKLNMNDNPNDYITELTKKNIFGKQGFTLDQAKAFAGVTEQRDKEYANIDLSEVEQCIVFKSEK